MGRKQLQDAPIILLEPNINPITMRFGLPLVARDRNPLMFDMALILTTLPDLSWRLPANSEVVIPGQVEKKGK